jgi:hypothetical protein
MQILRQKSNRSPGNRAHRAASAAGTPFDRCQAFLEANYKSSGMIRMSVSICPSWEKSFSSGVAAGNQLTRRSNSLRARFDRTVANPRRSGK